MATSMNLPTSFRALFMVLGLIVTPVSAGHAQAIDTSPARGHIVAFGLSDELNVFHSEATRAAAILARHYGREVAPLVYTNTRTSSTASVATLRDALARVASRMDRENDVLFLFLTSHGSPRGLAIQSGKRQGVLTPSQVGTLLRETGARKKILVVSACFSGIFVPLADPETLVITAADATHPSFGCEKRATWTYFGRAFFSQAIPKTDNLQGAFAIARSIVFARERKQGYESSNPQMSGGQSFAAGLRAVR
jgi:peptidase C13-like protein